MAGSTSEKDGGEMSKKKNDRGEMSKKKDVGEMSKKEGGDVPGKKDGGGMSEKPWIFKITKKNSQPKIDSLFKSL